MKLILEIKDDKVAFFMELLKNFSFVNVKPLTPYKANILEDVREAVEEVNLIKAEKAQSKPLSEFLNEL